jgi:hypothetical protein
MRHAAFDHPVAHATDDERCAVRLDGNEMTTRATADGVRIWKRIMAVIEEPSRTYFS